MGKAWKFWDVIGLLLITTDKTDNVQSASPQIETATDAVEKSTQNEAYFKHHDYLVKSESESIRQLDQIVLTISSAMCVLLLGQVEKVAGILDGMFLGLSLVSFTATIFLAYTAIRLSARTFDAERQDCVNARSATYDLTEDTQKLHGTLDRCNLWQNRDFTCAIILLVGFALVQLFSTIVSKQNHRATVVNPSQSSGTHKEQDLIKERSDMTEKSKLSRENTKIIIESDENKGVKPRPPAPSPTQPPPPTRPIDKPTKDK